MVQMYFHLCPTRSKEPFSTMLADFGFEVGFETLVSRASNRNLNIGKKPKIKMPCCLGMVLRNREKNVHIFFYHCHKRGLGQEKENKETQYIFKAGGINHIVSQISAIIHCSLTVIISTVSSVLYSSSVAPS